MVYELGEMTIRPGSEAAFEAAYAEALTLLRRAKGFRSAQVMRGLEHPDHYRVLIAWETLENHTDDFRGSPDHARLIELVRPHYAEPARILHYTVVDRA